MKNLKAVLFTFVLFFSVSSLSAQLEVKTNPVNLLFNIPDISVEYTPHENIGVEFMIGAYLGNYLGILGADELNRQSGFKARLTAKYYLIPETKSDGLYAGVYVGQRDFDLEEEIFGSDSISFSKQAVGFTAGFKMVNEYGIIYEIGFGLGRVVNGLDAEEVDAFARVSVGYRF